MIVFEFEVIYFYKGIVNFFMFRKLIYFNIKFQNENLLWVLIKVLVIVCLSYGVILRFNKINLSLFFFRFYYFCDLYDQILYSKIYNELFFSVCYYFNEN